MMFRSFFVAVVMTFFTLTVSNTANAEANLNIKDQIKAQLIAAAPLRGSGVAESTFNEKPILISFFASW